MDNSEEEKRQQGSSVERVNDLIKRAKSVRDNTRRAQRSTRAAAQTVRAAAQTVRAAVTAAQAAAATSEIWIPIIVILVVVGIIAVVFIPIFAIMPSGSGNGVNTCNNAGGVCGPSSACTSPGTIDPSFSCNTGVSTDVCCINSNLNCSDIPGAECQAGPSCLGDTILNGATCTEAGKPLCCAPKPICKKDLKFYCQYDKSYSNCNTITYSDGSCSNNGCNGRTTCDIEGNGCTPSSVAMVLASFGDTQWTPKNTALINGGAGCLCGGSSFNRQFAPWVRNQGYIIGDNLADTRSFHLARAKSYIDQGYIIVGAANIKYNRSLNSSGNHAFVITDIDSSGNATVFDPTFCSSDSEFSIRNFNVFGFNGKPIYNWINAYPVIKDTCIKI